MNAWNNCCCWSCWPEDGVVVVAVDDGMVVVAIDDEVDVVDPVLLLDAVETGFGGNPPRFPNMLQSRY